MLKYLIECHKFFVEKSRWYIGTWEWHDKGTRYEYAVPKIDIKHRLYYPVAYIKFMWFSINDYRIKKVLEVRNNTQQAKALILCMKLYFFQ